MIIRPYLATDKPDCLEAFKSNMPEFFAPAELPDFESWLDQQAAPAATDESKSREQYFVAELNGRAVGCGGYYIDLDTNKAIMTWGMIHRSLHRQGIGRQLFQYRIALIKSISPDSTIVLDTSQHAYPFFQKLGFVITKITRDFYAKGIDRYDMELK